MTDRLGQKLGNYQLLRLLGYGAFAEVYLGTYSSLASQVAVKVLKMHLTTNEVDKFLAEAGSLVNLTHPNIVRILDFGVEEDVPFLAMEYAPHGSLRQCYPSGSILSSRVVLFYVKQIASALQYLHNKNLIHGDIKSENMLLNSDNQVLLSDFGIAHFIETLLNPFTREMAKSITYRAPEQLSGEPCPASDQYGLAAVVYEWLSGQSPFSGTFPEIYIQQMFEQPRSLRLHIPNIPSRVEQVIIKALAKDPAQRFSDISAFSDALVEAYKFEQPAVELAPATAPAVSVSPTPSPDSYNPEDEPTIRMSRIEPNHVATNDYQVESTGTVTTVASFLPDDFDDAHLQLMPEIAVSPTHFPIAPTRQPETSARRHVSRRALVTGLGLAIVGVAGLAGVSVMLWRRSSPATVPQTTAPVKSTPAESMANTTFVTFQEATRPLYAVAWSPKGQRLACGGADNKVWVWTPTYPGWNMLYTYGRHYASINALAWSLNGTRIASASADKTVQIWDAFTGGNILTYTHHADVVRAAVWSPLGQYIASAGDDKTVQIWDATSGSLLATCKGHTKSVWSLSWSPDGQRVASASEDGTVKIWSISNGGLLFTYRHHTAGVKTVSWSPDGTSVASAGDDKVVQVWNPGTGAPLVRYRGHTDSVLTLAWSFDGKYIASGSWGQVRVWKLLPPGGATVSIYAGHTSAVHSLTWSPDSLRIASCGGNDSGPGDAIVQIWQAV